MTRMMIAAAVMLLGGCATPGGNGDTQAEDPKLTKALAGKVAGEPRDCLPLMDTRDSQTFNGSIVYNLGRSTAYRNDMQQCPMLGRDYIPVFNVIGSQVCRGDIVRFVDRLSGANWGSCVVGKFVPYKTPKS